LFLFRAYLKPFLPHLTISFFFGGSSSFNFRHFAIGSLRDKLQAGFVAVQITPYFPEFNISSRNERMDEG
jgi:hypothetical protein